MAREFSNVRIILTGAQGTGKTSVADGLRALGYEVNTSQQRPLIQSQSLNFNENGDERGQQEFMEAYLHSLEGKKWFIADRGPLDVVAYTQVLYDMNKVSVDFWHKQREQLFRFESIHTSPKITYLYFAPAFPIKEDGIRSSSEDYQHMVDNALYKLLNTPTRSYYTVPLDMNIEERVEWCERLIRQLQLSRKFLQSSL